MPDIGPLELVIILVIVLVVFGPKRLPSLGRQLGRGMREFKDGITGKDNAADEEREQLPAAPADAQGERDAQGEHDAMSAPSARRED
jgi:sec-independent protein translocase protein TatA